jgi:hypothetical protein
MLLLSKTGETNSQNQMAFLAWQVELSKSSKRALSGYQLTCSLLQLMSWAWTHTGGDGICIAPPE